MSDKHTLLKVTKILDHGEANDGTLVGVKMADEKEREFVMLVPHGEVAELQARLAAGAGYAKRRRDNIPEGEKLSKNAVPLPVQGISVGRRGDGVFVLRIDLGRDVVLESPLPTEALPQLRDGFEKAATLAARAAQGDGAGEGTPPVTH